MSSYLTLLTETLKSGDLDKTSMYPAALAAGIAHLPSAEADALLTELAKRRDLDDATQATLRGCRSVAARTAAWRTHGRDASLEEWEKAAVTEANPSTLEEMRRYAPWAQLSQQAIDGLLERGSTRVSKTLFTRRTASVFAELTPSDRMGYLLREAITLLPTDKVPNKVTSHLVSNLLAGNIAELDVLNTDPVYLLAHACSVHAEPDEAQLIISEFPDLPARLRPFPDVVSLIRRGNATLQVNRVADVKAVEALLKPLSDENNSRSAALAEKADAYTTERFMELIAKQSTNRSSLFGIPEVYANWERLASEQRTDTTCVAILRNAPTGDARTRLSTQLCTEVVEHLDDRAADLLQRNWMLAPDPSSTPPDWMRLVDQGAWVRAIASVSGPRVMTAISRAPQEDKDALVAHLIAEPDTWSPQAVQDLAAAWREPLGPEVWKRLTTEQLAKIADQPGVRAWLVAELTRPVLASSRGAVAAAAVLDASAPWEDALPAVSALA